MVVFGRHWTALDFLVVDKKALAALFVFLGLRFADALFSNLFSFGEMRRMACKVRHVNEQARVYGG